MHWLKKIKEVSILSFKKSSEEDNVVEVDDLSDDTKKENEIDTEGLAIKLSKHFPNLHSVMEKNAEIQELKDTLQRLQQDFTDETKQTVLQSLREDDTKRASDLLKKLILPHASKEEQPTEMTAMDWIDIGNITLLSDPQKALSAYRTAIKLDPSNTDAWIRLGRVSYWQENYDTAQQAYEKVLKLSGNNKVLQAISYGNLGVIFKIRGELDKAEESYLKSFRINEALGRKADMASAHCNLGAIYYTRGEYGKAEERYLKSLRIYDALGQQDGIANQYCNLGIIYKNRGEFEKAEDFYLKSLEIYKTLGRNEGIASSYANLGVVYKIQGKPNKAEEFHLKSLEINSSLDRMRGIASDYGNLGNVYKIRGELDKACNFWNKSLESFSKIDAKEQIRMIEELIAVNCKKE
ncbi:MAG: tetratricopeptide repeat protein [Planctomycetota bacterium]|jgi:tetratricopeptide (TPR) repeat protein